MELYLVRHGEAASQWGQSDDPGLSDLGQQQAKATASVLRPLLDTSVELVSSPMLRARETAEPLSALLSTEVKIVDAFREIPAPVGTLNKKTWLNEFMQQSWNQQPAELLQWRAGAMTALLQMQQSTVVFTHFMLLNAIVAELQQRQETVVFLPDNASVTRLRLRDGVLELVESGAQMTTVIN
ncbi:MAG: histidine phosphatase family protein [Pseudomonadales bacterium]